MRLVGFVPIAAALPALLAACASAPSFTSQADCAPSGSPVEAGIGGEAIMGVGNDGFISDTDVVFTTRVSPGGSGCPAVGVNVGG